MRIAIFSDTYAPEINGVARTLKRYVEYLEEKKIDYRLFVPENGESKTSVPQIERSLSTPFLFYKECRIVWPNPMRLKAALDEFQPTMIHVATPFNLGLYGMYYGKTHNLPMIASYHTNFDDYLTCYRLSFLNKWVWKYLQWFHRPFDRVYVPSVNTKERVIKQKLHPHIDIWGRGVDHSLFSPDKHSLYLRKYYNIQEKHILLYVGRISQEKDIQTVLKTFHLLPTPLQKDTHLLIVGDGPLLKPLTERKHPQITFTGFIEGESLAEIYASSDVFLFPSATETFGNVVLEALASGLPVIGAKAGGVQQLIRNNQTGFLCPPKHEEAFSRYTGYLLANDELRQTFSQQARASALAYSWNEIFDRLLVSFQSLHNEKKRHTA